MKKHFMLCLLIIGLATNYSCRKSELHSDMSLPKSYAATPPGGTFDYSDWPTVNNGMLEFRDGDHLKTYFDFLDEITQHQDSTGEDSTVYDMDSLLYLVEGNLSGFTSVRGDALENWLLLDEVGWDNVEDIPAKHFITPIYLRSILNLDLDVKIGDHIYHFINKDWCVKFPAENTGLLEDVHGLTDAATLEDITALEAADELVPYSLCDDNICPTALMKTTFTEFRISTPYVKVPDPCNNSKKIRLEGINLLELGTMTLNQGYYQIDWGDGNITYHTSDHGLNSAYLDVEHTYSSFAKYTIKMKARSVSPISSGFSYISNSEFKVDVKNSTCKYDYSKKSWTEWHYTPDGNRAWNGWCEVLQGYDWWGAAINRILAETECFEWRRGKWRNVKGNDPSIEIWCDIYDGSCNYQYNKFSYHYPGGSSSASLNTGLGARFGWSELRSRHRIKHNGQFHSFDLVLKTCD